MPLSSFNNQGLGTWFINATWNALEKYLTLSRHTLQPARSLNDINTYLHICIFIRESTKKNEKTSNIVRAITNKPRPPTQISRLPNQHWWLISPSPRNPSKEIVQEVCLRNKCMWGDNCVWKENFTSGNNRTVYDI